GLLGEERMVDFQGRADVRDGRVLLDADGQFGGGDELKALIDAHPDGDRFDIDVNYRAPAGGLLATLVGAEQDLRARVVGDGDWDAWTGSLVVEQERGNIAAFRLYNRAGRYKIVGQARPEGYLTGLPAAAWGEVVSLAAVGTLEDSILDGTLAVRGRGVSLDGEGAIDLADNAFEALQLQAILLDNQLFGPGLTLDNAVARVTLDGSFSNLAAPVELSIGDLNAGGTRLIGIAQRGTVTYDGTRWTLPLDASV